MYVDTHTHLGMHPDKTDVELIRAATNAGVQVLIDVGTELDNSREAIARAQVHTTVWATVGIHPNSTAETTDSHISELEMLANNDRVVALGETGLDYFRDWAPKEKQQQIFREHLRIANELDKAVVVHCRDTDHGGTAGPAWKDCVETLLDAPKPRRVVLHCFSGDASVIEVGIEHGWYFSYAGNLTYSNAEALRISAAQIPADQLLTETDAPYLTPVPFRGKQNEAANVVHTMHQLAKVKNIDVEAFAGQLLANTHDAFNL